MKPTEARQDPDAVLAALDFALPPERIAQRGAEPRDASRLMVVRAAPEHRRFFELPQFLKPGDLLVTNRSRVIPARLSAHKPRAGRFGGGAVEVLLLQAEEGEGARVWSALLKPARRAGGVLHFGDPESPLLRAEVLGNGEGGARRLRFDRDPLPHLEGLGRLPLPPYIAAGDDDGPWRERYQTVYAQESGSVAAPTAGLHFTPRLLAELHGMGVQRAEVVLHVGAGTFKPIVGPVSEHTMHRERYAIPEDTARAVNRARAEGRRVVAVGTTTVRALESAVRDDKLQAGEGETDIFITPGHRFAVPDLMVTNLHLPGSTLLLLVAAFAGVERIRAAYAAALQSDYRFYSLGDAMLLERG